MTLCEQRGKSLSRWYMNEPAKGGELMKMRPMKWPIVLGATCLILVFVGSQPPIPNVDGKWHAVATLA